MALPPFDLEALLVAARAIAACAARRILEIYAGNFTVTRKHDGSPVTEADMAAHTIIVEALAALQPRLPVLSEESTVAPFTERRAWEACWLVDPLDGTREFVHRRNDFTVNIALVYRHRSILGVVHVPVESRCYAAAAGMGAYCFTPARTLRLAARQTLAAMPVVAVSAAHFGKKTRAFLERLGPHKLVRRGSMIKCCLIAAAQADIYPRLGDTYEWDTAAGQCVLEEAGGHLTDWAGRPLRYNMQDSLINPPFVAFAPAARKHVDFSMAQGVP